MVCSQTKGFRIGFAFFEYSVIRRKYIKKTLLITVGKMPIYLGSFFTILKRILAVKLSIMPVYKNKIKSFISTLLIILFYSANLLAQEPVKPVPKIKGDPLFIIDGKEASKSDLEKINPNDIAEVTVLKEKAIELYGERGRNGVLLIETKFKNNPEKQEVKQSKFEPELLIISPGKVSFDPLAAESIENANKKLKAGFGNREQPDLSNVKEENSRLMIQSAILYAGKLNFFSQIPLFSQEYLTYRFIERFPNTLVLLKDITAENGLTNLAKIAGEEKMPYVLSFPSAHIAKEKGQFVLYLKVQLYEAETNSLVLDKEYRGDQTNQGFEFSCDGSIRCTINNALSGALADVIRQIALNNKTLQAEGLLAKKRFGLIEAEIFSKQSDPSLIKSVISQSDSTINLSDLYQTFYNPDKSKFVGFLISKVDKLDLKSLSENKKDRHVKILTGASIKDKNFLDVPQQYAYIVKGVLSNGKWYYKKDMVTYFDAESEKEGKLTYLNNLQDWGYFKDKLSVIDPDFWEGKLFEKVEDKRKNPNWEDYKDMWESEEREDRDYIGMYRLVADRLKEERKVLVDNFKDSIANHVFKPFYDAAIKSKQRQIAGYEPVLKNFLLIYSKEKKVIINPMAIKDDKGVVKQRYFVFLPASGEVFEWNYFPPFIKKKGNFENRIMENLAKITRWNYSYDTLDDEQFWNNYVLIKESGVYKYLK